MRMSGMACAVVVAGSIGYGSGVVARARAAAPAALLMQRCQVVPGQKLEAFYPVMPGWERGAPKSETDAAESVSRTTVNFERNVSRISVELMDSCRNPDVLALLMESLKQLPPATRGTVVRHVTINEFPGTRNGPPRRATARCMCSWPDDLW